MPNPTIPEFAVAVLGDHTPSLSSLKERVRRLGHRIIRASSFEQAIELSKSRNLRYTAALLDPEIAASGLGRAMNELRLRTQSPRLVYLAAGKRPKNLPYARLAEAGVQLALWDPVSNNDLRFQLNRAISGWTHDQLRGEFRAPTDWATRIFARGREKHARIYTFSGSGAFLTTPRPSMKGADVTLELPLPSGLVHVAGRVVYTNVPGNRRRAQLPNGMAVQFEGTPADVGRAIRESVDAKTSHLMI